MNHTRNYSVSLTFLIREIEVKIRFQYGKLKQFLVLQHVTKLKSVYILNELYYYILQHMQ